MSALQPAVELQALTALVQSAHLLGLQEQRSNGAASAGGGAASCTVLVLVVLLVLVVTAEVEVDERLVPEVDKDEEIDELARVVEDEVPVEA
jgi:hypothetical protein